MLFLIWKSVGICPFCIGFPCFPSVASANGLRLGEAELAELSVARPLCRWRLGGAFHNEKLGKWKRIAQNVQLLQTTKANFEQWHHLTYKGNIFSCRFMCHFCEFWKTTTFEPGKHRPAAKPAMKPPAKAGCKAPRAWPNAEPPTIEAHHMAYHSKDQFVSTNTYIAWNPNTEHYLEEKYRNI